MSHECGREPTCPRCQRCTAMHCPCAVIAQGDGDSGEENETLDSVGRARDDFLRRRRRRDPPQVPLYF